MDSSIPVIGDLMHILGEYYAHGEFGVVFTAKGYGDRLVKIVNLDAENDENLVNASQLQMFQTVLDYGVFEGVPEIFYVLESEVTDMVRNHIKSVLMRSNNYEAIRVLGLEKGDTIGVWMMEELKIIGIDEELSLKSNAMNVGRAAAKIWNEYQFFVTDLQSANYGQNKAGEFVIFDPIPSPDVPSLLYFMDDEEKIAQWFYENQVWVDGKPASKI